MADNSVKVMRRVTANDRWDAYDALPKAVRRALQEGPKSWGHRRVVSTLARLGYRKSRPDSDPQNQKAIRAVVEWIFRAHAAEAEAGLYHKAAEASMLLNHPLPAWVRVTV